MQRQVEEEEEEEEPIQTKPLEEAFTSLLQRQVEPEEEEEEEPVQTKPLEGAITSDLQRQIEPEEEEEEEPIQAKLTNGHVLPMVDFLEPSGEGEEILVQRQEEDLEEEEETLQTQSVNATAGKASPGVGSSLNSLNGSGQPLSKSARDYFEPRFGCDFSGVRIHTDSKAAEAARSMSAKAFTMGRNVVFGAGQYSPDSLAGRRLLAHELTHTIQQNNVPRISSRDPERITPIHPRTHRDVIQKQGIPPGCPRGITFSTDPHFVIVPNCPGRVRARTVPPNLRNITWSLSAGTAAVATRTTINQNGRITFDATQTGGTIEVTATGPAGPPHNACYYTRPLVLRSFPTGINMTFVSGPPPNPAVNYGAVFDHVFISNDGNVASLQGVGVGERFNGIPNPAGAVHNIVAPINPFGGVFVLRTSTLTPNATNNWHLTPTGQLGGTRDQVYSEKARINVGRFIQSASNPRPRRTLPADMTLIQSLYWYCRYRRPWIRRWIRFVNVAHSRTLRRIGGTVQFVTTVNGIEQIDLYTGPVGVFNVNASPINTPRSPAPPTAPRTVRITADTLPAVLRAGHPLIFSVIRPRLGCTIAPDPTNDHAAILTIGRRPGRVIVQVADSTRVNRARVTVRIT